MSKQIGVLRLKAGMPAAAAESVSPRAAQLQAQSASPRKAESVSAIATTEDPLF